MHGKAEFVIPVVVEVSLSLSQTKGASHLVLVSRTIWVFDHLVNPLEFSLLPFLIVLHNKGSAFPLSSD